MWLLITGFSWSTNPKKTFLIARSKGQGTLPWLPNFGQNRPKITKNRPKNHKNGHNFSCKRYIHAEFGFEIGFVLSGNSSDSTVHMYTWRYHGNQFWDKIAINAYVCISTRDNENAVTYNGVFVVSQSKEDISDCNSLRDVAMATKFCQK